MKQKDIKFGIVATKDGGYDFIRNGEEEELALLMLNAMVQISSFAEFINKMALTYLAISTTSEKVAEIVEDMQADEFIQKQRKDLMEWKKRMEMIQAMEMNANKGAIKP